MHPFILQGYHGFIYLFEGGGSINHQNVSANTLIVLDGSRTADTFIAGKHGARFLLISGKPINESIVQYGPFVMNTTEEIKQAMQEYHSNNFVRERAWIKHS